MKTYEKHIKFFGTDGIRGDASKFPFDDYTLSVIGRSAAEELHAPKGTILILRDTRQSGERIERALAKGIAQAGLKTVFAGVLTTPAAAALLKSGKYCAAVVISASHNPWEDNGIKIFNSKGSKLSDSTEMRIEKRINSYLSSPKNLKSLKCKAAPKKDSSLLKTYENFIIKNFGKGSLKGKTIVVDCANGAAYKCAPAVLKKLGAKVIALNTKPDGKNINLNCGALHPECAAQAVKKNKAFCGFAFDGDADRLICIDETGVVKDGDFFLAAMSADMKKRGKLRNNILVTTVMANLGLMLAMKAAGIKTIVSKVGDRYVLEDMKKYKASLGGEQSGHFIFLDILGTGDGLLSAVRLLAALNRENKTMSQFLTGVEKFPQILVNRKVAQKIPLEKLPESVALIGNYEKELGAEGRILVRYSGTENLLRVMVEGKDAQRIKAIADEITDSITAEVEKLGS